jgi:phospholipid transport system substrate-binding protein
MMHRRYFLALPAGLLLARPAAAATDPATAAAFIKKLLGDVLAVINAGPPDLMAKLQPLIDADVDVAGIASFCVGRFWRTATPAQQAEYVRLFRRVLMKNVLGRVGEYKGTTFDIGPATAKDSAISVVTMLNRPNIAPNRVEWMVADVSGPKVIDVLAEGTSLRLTQRSDYTAFIAHNNNTLQALIDALKAQAAG